MSPREDSAAAYRRAVENGSLQAWLDGKQIQWRVDRYPTKVSRVPWFDLDSGSAPDFAGVNTHWRVKPVQPTVKFTATADDMPGESHNLLEDVDIILQLNEDGSVIVTTVEEFSGDFWMLPSLSRAVDSGLCFEQCEDY